MQNLRWRELILPQQDSLRLHYIDDNPIDLAFHHGHVDIVKTMLDYLHSTSKTVSLSSGQLLVRRAIIRNEWPLLDALLRLGVSTTYRYTYGDEQGARLIRIACQFGSKDCIDVFMKHVDTVDQSGQTARYQLTRMNKFLNVGYKMPAQYSNKEKTGETVNGGQSQTHDRMPDKVSDSTHEQAPPGFDRYGDHFLSLDTKTRAYPSEAPQRRSRWLVGGKDSVKVVEGPRITGYGVSTCFPHGAIDNGILDLNQAMGHCIFFTRLFTECNDFPKHWLRHCLFAACQEGWAYLADLIVTITAGSELVLVSDEVSRLYEYTDPCELAFHNGHHDIVKLVLLLPEYTVPEPFVRDLLQDALERDDADMLSSLLKHGVDLDFRLNDMMRTILAAHQNNTEKCTKLLVEREVAVAPTTQQHKSLYDLLKTKSIEFTSVSMP
ncbi:MAG: hypothetical protein LQ346_002806 [Caloplaca aetnensis]|nr:MAG: hypothetical protein LQ346_002806 [Caloplaca aetnensis]